MTVKKVKTSAGDRWEVRGHTGGRGSKMVRRRFSRKEDAQRWATDKLREKQSGGVAEASRLTVDEYAAEWWARAEPHLALHSRINYSGALRRYVLPMLGHVRLSALTAPTVSRFKSDLQAADKGAPTVRYCLAVLSAICRDAVERGQMTHNPVAAIKMPTAPRQRAVRAISPTDVEKLRHQAPTAADGLLVSVLAYAGLRPEEALALTWGDVGERVLIVDKAVTHGQVKGTKNAKNRTVDIIGPLAEDLRAARVTLGRIPAASELVFPHPQDGGRPWGAATYRNWMRRTFGDMADRAGLDGITPYTLRHSFVSLLLAGGRRPGEVAEQAGHSLAVCQDTYAHVIAEFRGVAVSDPAEEVRKARVSSVCHRADSDAAAAAETG
jgi:integrase